MTDIVVLLDNKPVLAELSGGEGSQSAVTAALASELAEFHAAQADLDAQAAEAAASIAVDAAGDATESADEAAASEAVALTAEEAATAAHLAVITALGGTPLANATINAASRAILAALSTGSGLPAFLTEAGYEGLFVFNNSDLSAQVTADPGQVNYVAPTAAPTGASGAWVRRSLTVPSLELGATDTTLTRSSAGNVAVEGNVLYRAGGTDVPVADGGTGASTAAGAATNLGLGTADSPQFTSINVGHATDTPLARLSAGDVEVAGNRLFRVGGTDVPVADGGTGSSTAAGARTNFGVGTGDTPSFAGVAAIGATGVGYAAGAGGTVIQLTNKSTSVTLNKTSGQITMHSASLAAGATAAFTFTNSTIAATDLVIVQLQLAGAGAHSILDYTIKVGQQTNGGCSIALRNDTAGAIAEGLVLNFAVIKGAIT